MGASWSIVREQGGSTEEVTKMTWHTSADLTNGHVTGQGPSHRREVQPLHKFPPNYNICLIFQGDSCGLIGH